MYFHDVGQLFVDLPHLFKYQVSTAGCCERSIYVV